MAGLQVDDDEGTPAGCLSLLPCWTPHGLEMSPLLSCCLVILPKERMPGVEEVLSQLEEWTLALPCHLPALLLTDSFSSSQFSVCLTVLFLLQLVAGVPDFVFSDKVGVQSVMAQGTWPGKRNFWQEKHKKPGLSVL